MQQLSAVLQKFIPQHLIPLTEHYEVNQYKCAQM